MASRPPTLAARALEPLAASLWTLFLVWTGIVLLVWVGGIGDVEMQERVTNPGLRSGLEVVLRTLDAVWFAIGAANVYLALVESESLSIARRWAGLIIGGAWLIAALSVWTTFPLGAIHYTARLGMRIGPVPFGLLLVWLTFVLGARSLALWLAPRASHLKVSIAAAAFVALTLANLDPLAWRFRALWLWRPTADLPPALAFLQNVGTWLLATFGFVFVMRETRVASSSFGGFPRQATVLLIFNAVFLLTHGIRFFRATGD